MTFPVVIRIISPGDARGWIGFGSYALVLIVLAMIYWSDKNLLDNDFFKVIATALILTGWNGGPVGWAYQATKSGTEAAASSARIAETSAGVPVSAQPQVNGTSPVPADAAEAAEDVAGAATARAAEIGGQAA